MGKPGDDNEVHYSSDSVHAGEESANLQRADQGVECGQLQLPGIQAAGSTPGQGSPGDHVRRGGFDRDEESSIDQEVTGDLQASVQHGGVSDGAAKGSGQARVESFQEEYDYNSFGVGVLHRGLTGSPPRFETADAMFRHAVSLCVAHGVKSAPRGRIVYEVPFPVTLTLTNVHRPFIADPIRRVNYRFGFAEAAWILSGSDDAQLIGRYNKRMLSFSDNGRTLWGAYGPRLMGQLNHVVSTLKRDPDSRQAVVTTWRPQVGMVYDSEVSEIKQGGLVPANNEYGAGWDGASWRSKDIPCTVAWHFTIRNGRLNLTVFMRSHDVWLGMPYDVLSFTTVQRVVASMLEVEPGEYNHVLSNLHLYGDDFNTAANIPRRPSCLIPSVPHMGDYFCGMDSRVVAGIFGSILSGSREYQFRWAEPFFAALHRDPNAWTPWRGLMAANNRKRPAKA